MEMKILGLLMTVLMLMASGEVSAQRKYEVETLLRKPSVTKALFTGRQSTTNDECGAQGELGQLAEKINPLSCLNRPEVQVPNLSNRQTLTDDLGICQCLKDAKLPQTTHVMKNQSKKTPVENFQDMVTLTQKRLNSKRNGLGFQASVLSDGDGKFTEIFSASVLENENKSGEKAIETVVKKKTQEAILAGQRQEKVSDWKFLQGSESKEKKNEVTEDVTCSMDSLKFPDVDQRYLTDEPFVPGQCVGAREFMAYKQLPNNEIVFGELATNKDPKNWDYRLLRSRYDLLMKGGKAEKMKNREEILVLKAKLEYLGRNPFFKSILSASPENLNNLLKDAGADKKQRNELLKLYDPKELEKLKTNLLGVMANTGIKASCTMEEADQCLGKAFKDGKVETYKEGLRQFFATNANALKIAQLETDKDMLADIEDLSSEDQLGKPVNRVISQEALMGEVMQDGFKHPRECRPDMKVASLAEACERSYAAYCAILDDVQRNGDLNSAEDDLALLDDLDSKEANYFNLDLRTNPEFKEFNDKVCNTPRKSSKAKPGDAGVTFETYRLAQCAIIKNCVTDPKSIQDLRQKYLAEYPLPQTDDQTDPDRDDVNLFYTMIKTDPVESTKSVAKSGKGPKKNLFELPDLSGFAEAWGVSSSNGGGLANAATTIGKGFDPESETKHFEEKTTGPNQAFGQRPETEAPDYSPYMNQPIAQSPEVPRVENLSDERRRDLLNEIQDDLSELQKSPVKSADASIREAEMKSQIEALQALLANQKKLTEDQYKLLNDAIAAHTPEASKVAQSPTGTLGPNPERSNVPSTTRVEGTDLGRGPASVRDVQFLGGGLHSGSLSGVSKTFVPRGEEKIAASADSIAREEAKLVNLRRMSDGTISIESVGTSSANAITVPVSDEQYRLLQANPTGLNLGQIEKIIPEDQIAKLEKNGEIIILLKNGSNPPFEVKVEKKDNKLVYKLKDKLGLPQSPIVKRTYTREALNLHLKN